jgi:hypothetical protein
MKPQIFSRLIFTFFLFFGIAHSTCAALITTEFSDLVGNQGTVDIQLTLADGETTEGFSLYFSETLFANLSIISSPVEWDSIVIQPDVFLGEGLFDSLNLSGLTSGSARVAFTYLGLGPIEALAYDFYNADFEVTQSGTSTNVTRSVPESSSLLLMLLGLGALGAAQLRSRSQAATSQQVAA